jgi:hypothetical protein
MSSVSPSSDPISGIFTLGCLGHAASARSPVYPPGVISEWRFVIAWPDSGFRIGESVSGTGSGFPQPRFRPTPKKPTVLEAA